jgi:hypothetical protein
MAVISGEEGKTGGKVGFKNASSGGRDVASPAVSGILQRQSINKKWQRKVGRYSD